MQLSDMGDIQIGRLYRQSFDDIAFKTTENIQQLSLNLSSGNLTDQKLSVALMQIAKTQSKHIRACLS